MFMHVSGFSLFRPVQPYALHVSAGRSRIRLVFSFNVDIFIITSRSEMPGIPVT